jgi:hypothetical protein
MRRCTHLARIRDVEPSAQWCEECRHMGAGTAASAAEDGL